MSMFAGLSARRPLLLARVTALLTLGGGIANLLALLNPVWPHERVFQEVFPLEFLHVSRLVSLVLGFALSVGSIHLFRRKRRAFHVVLALAIASLIFHLTKGRDFPQAIYSAVVIAALLASRRCFTVKSGEPQLRAGLLQLAAGLAVALAYGVAGFWLLDRRDFGVDFHISEALAQSLRTMLLQQSPDSAPHTAHARWFLASLDVMTVTAIGYAALSLFRPALYRLSTVPRERHAAEQVRASHGLSAIDYFKLWPDKSIWLSHGQDCFVAYRVGANYAVALGDPVGPPGRIGDAIDEFLDFVQEHDWGAVFHQALPDFLPLYRARGLRKLKIGDEAIVDLTTFSLDGKSKKSVRSTLNQLERAGVKLTRYDPPLSDAVLARLRAVSDLWLELPGRRERRFTLGLFDPDYVRRTPVLAVEDTAGQLLAFANLIPSYCKGETTIDLMRHHPDAPNGTMDFLFVRAFEHGRAHGFTRFNMGMAPMSGFAEKEDATGEERAIHYFIQRLNTLFSFRGLRQFKAKYATSWEPRYLVYRNSLALPAIALALRQVCEIGGGDEE